MELCRIEGLKSGHAIAAGQDVIKQDRPGAIFVRGLPLRKKE